MERLSERDGASAEDVRRVERCFSTSLGICTRRQLAFETGLTDRVVRKCIAELVTRGAPILGNNILD
jgi:hypothetical protein